MMKKLLYFVVFIFVATTQIIAQDTNNTPPQNLFGGGNSSSGGNGGRQSISCLDGYFVTTSNKLLISWNCSAECEMVVKDDSGNEVCSFALVTDGAFHFYPLPTLNTGMYSVECYADENLICIGEFYKP